MLLYGIFEQTGSKKKVVQGGIIRGDKNIKELCLIFMGHEFLDGADTILRTLKKNNVKGTFFLTGDFFRKFPLIVNQLQEDGHYMGPHSDKHLLYADWTKRDSTLVTFDEFVADLQNNYTAMTDVGLRIELPKYFMPPYEWHNQKVVDIAQELNQITVNFSHGTKSNADYTTPEMPNYKSSNDILKSIFEYEKSHDLNGFHLLIKNEIFISCSELFFTSFTNCTH